MALIEAIERRFSTVTELRPDKPKWFHRRNGEQVYLGPYEENPQVDDYRNAPIIEQHHRWPRLSLVQKREIVVRGDLLSKEDLVKQV